MNKNAIELKDVRYCYNNICAVNNVDFSIEKNKVTAFLGPNGGGKSTLIKLLVGILKPDKGEIIVKDNLSIGYVSQWFNFDEYFPITVREAVLIGTLDKKIKPFMRYTNIQKKKASEAIKKVELEGFENRGLNQLSGGQLKRVIIARLLASDAQIMILDEPDNNLDIQSIKELYDLLESLKKDKTIIVASHRIDYMLNKADVAIYIDKKANVYNPLNLKEKLKKGMNLW